ncbi:MAG: hypothetical protein ACOH5I_10500 [Oligoflexus sp.]
MKAHRAFLFLRKPIPTSLIGGLAVPLLLTAACGEEPSGFVELASPGYDRSADAEVLDAETREDDAYSDITNDFEELAEIENSTTEQVSEGADSPEQLKEHIKRLPKFGLLVNDLECGLCHVTVYGNVASNRRVPPLWTDSDVRLTGTWWVADVFEGAARANVNVQADGGIHQTYAGPELPVDRTGDGRPDFPAISFSGLRTKMRGNVQASLPELTGVQKVYDGNLILLGTEQNPIRIQNDILVEGDLVIKGVYTGVGTIYVRGNIYIPADLRAKRSAFPFPESEEQALALAANRMNNTDALGLATAGSIFIADLEKHQNTYSDLAGQTVYNFHATPLNRQAEALGVYDLYDWYPGGVTEYNKLYENAYNCNNQATQHASFNLVEAFLYAQNTVAGIARQSSYSIRGGVIADYFHLVSGASLCNANISVVHGKPVNRSYIEYDYRIKTGELTILEYIGAQFPGLVDESI